MPNASPAKALHEEEAVWPAARVCEQRVRQTQQEPHGGSRTTGAAARSSAPRPRQHRTDARRSRERSFHRETPFLSCTYQFYPSLESPQFRSRKRQSVRPRAAIITRESREHRDIISSYSLIIAARLQSVRVVLVSQPLGQIACSYAESARSYAVAFPQPHCPTL